MGFPPQVKKRNSWNSITILAIIIVHSLFLTLSFAKVSGQSKKVFNPPRLTLGNKLSDDLEKNGVPGKRTVDINHHTTLHLHCEGNRPLLWKFPANHMEEKDDIALTFKNDTKCETVPKPWCKSDFYLPNTTYEHTGLYTCLYEDTTDQVGVQNSDSIYIFVNDPNNLLVPYEGNPYIFISVIQSHPATIPCIPSSSKVNVSLWKPHTKSGNPEMIQVGEQYGVTYDPTQGFHFQRQRWDDETSFLNCRAILNNVTKDATVNIHWSIEATYGLHPTISDDEAKQVFLNGNFSLTCVVHLEPGVLITMHWTHPVRKPSRVIEGEAKTERAGQGGDQYETVKKKLTVLDVQREDEGTYYCNVTDAASKMYSASKYINVYDQSYPASVNFTVDTNKPFLRKVGENVTFAITVRAIPDISSVDMYWLKDGKRIADARGLQRDLEFGKTHYVAKISKGQALLTINKITMEDTGAFTLVGNTKETVTNITVKLVVQGPPVVAFRNTFPFYQKDKQYTLGCQVLAYPTPIIYWKWLPCPNDPSKCAARRSKDWMTIDEESFSPNNESMSPVHLDDVGNLSRSYLNTTAKTTGLYRCFGQNVNGTNYVETLFTVSDINGEKGFAISSSILEIVEMEDITLSCKANSFNYSQVRWFFQKKGNNTIFAVKPNDKRILLSLTSTDYSIVANLRIKSLSLDDSGVYLCNASSRSQHGSFEIQKFEMNVLKAIAPVILSTNMKGQTIEQAPTTMNEFYCEVTGRPKPKVVWYKNGKLLNTTGMFGVEIEKDGQKLVIKRLVDEDKGRYECRVSNSMQTLHRFANLKVTGNDSGLTAPGIAGIVICVIVGVVFVTMAVFLGKRIREERIQQKEMAIVNRNLFHHGQVEFYNPDLGLSDQVELLPYDPHWEFPKERLKLGRTLGQGAFGRVVRAEAIGLEDGEPSTPVAVKMLKERADQTQQKALIAELKILIHVGRHLNIVNLLGAVTKNINKGELMVMVEYCRFGNLRHYLLAHRDNFVNQMNVDTGEIDLSVVYNSKRKNSIANKTSRVYENIRDIGGITNPSYQLKTSANNNNNVKYAELLHNQTDESLNGITIDENSFSGTGDCSNSNSNSKSSRFHVIYRSDHSKKSKKDVIVTTCDLICYAFQVARGMEYLARRKVIHRDLAARNVLLADDNIVKICDFGLAKDCYKYDNYVKKGDGPLPVKWMAIESIRDKVFTTKSDVWSFGVLIWEFFTLGGNPYPGIEIDEEFYKKLKNGYRMEKPDVCPQAVYDTMLNCWSSEPRERPDFTQLAEAFGDLLEANVRQHYLDLNNPYQQTNEENSQQKTDYLQMSVRSSQEQSDYLNMISKDDTNSRPGSDPLQHYDAVHGNNPVSNKVVAMEVVPMIHFDTCEDKVQHRESINKDNRLCTSTYTDHVNEYLKMNTTGHSPPPHYEDLVH